MTKPETKSLLALALMAPVAAAAADKKPNIIFFLVDDYGWTDSQVAYGDRVYPNNLRYATPNMLRLSEKGVIMTNAYAASLSTPTRTSLMTGMNPAHEKITIFTSGIVDQPRDFAGIGDNEPKCKDPDENFVRGDFNWNGIDPCCTGLDHALPCTPFVQHLRDNGYYTIHVGKGHWAPMGTPGSEPRNYGFLVNIGGSYITHAQSHLGQDCYGNKPGLWSTNAIPDLSQYYNSDVFLSDALTREAKKALDRPIETGEPFYLFMSHYSVHIPLQPDNRFIRKYLDEGRDYKEACYAAMVEGVDRSLGELMDYLEEKGVADNTVIILLGDNGALATNQAERGGPGMHTQNLPLREGKASVYEGGVREPMLVYWPGKTVGGTRISTPVSCEDLYPSIMEIAGIREYETVQEIDGVSWADLVSKGSEYVAKARRKGLVKNQSDEYGLVIPESVSGVDPERVLVYHHPHRWRKNSLRDIDFMSAVRKGDWKLVYRMREGSRGDALRAFELYNLREDMGERHNLAGQYPEKVRELALVLSDRLRSWDATMPVDKESGRVCPWPDEVPDMTPDAPVLPPLELERVADLADWTPEDVIIRGSTQGFAIYDRYCVVLHDKGQCAIFDMEEKRLVSTYMLEGNTSHCNNANFSNRKLTPGSPFPLLYVSECTGSHACFVTDITLEGSRIVQKIFLDDSKCTGNIDWTLDETGGYLYALEGSGPGKPRTLTCFPLPPTDMPEVHYTLADALSEPVDVSSVYIGQGSVIHKNLAFLPDGAPAYGVKLHAFDLLTGKSVLTRDLSDIGLEPEGLAVKGSWLYMIFHVKKQPRHSVLCRFSLDC